MLPPNRIAKRLRASSGPLASVTDSDTFTCDAASRMLTAVGGRYSNTVTYTYDSAGRKSTESLTISGQTLHIDDRLRCRRASFQVDLPRCQRSDSHLHASVGNWRRSPWAAPRSTPARMMTASSYNNGVSESRAYNTDNTLASISFTGAAIGDLSYRWDGNALVYRLQSATENKNKTP